MILVEPMHIDNLFDELPEQLTKSDKQLLSVITGICKQKRNLA